MAEHHTAPEDELLGEYDLTGGVRGKYADEFTRNAVLVQLDPDVAALFPDSAAVNQALRAYSEQMRTPAA
jgi:hypothetical protein